MLCCRPFAGRLVVFNEHSLEVIPRVNDIWLEAGEPIHCGELEYNWQVIFHHVGVTIAGLDGDGITRQPLLRVGVAVVWLDPVDLEVCGPPYSAEPCREGSRAVSDDGSVNSNLWSNGGCDSWSSDTGWRSDDKLSNVAGGMSGGVARVSRLKWLKSGFGIAPLLVIFLSATDFTLVARVAIPVDATAKVMELVEVAPNVSTTGLVDFLVGVGVGVAW
jgi:hypothetical protein